MAAGTTASHAASQRQSDAPNGGDTDPLSLPEELSSALSDPNLTTVSGLEFLVQRALNGDAKLPYDPQLLRECCTASRSSVLGISDQFKKRYGKDFSPSMWAAKLRETKASLEIDAIQGNAHLLTNSQGIPKPILANAIIQLKQSREKGGASLNLRFDSFSSAIIHAGPSPWQSSERWSDRDDIEAANFLQHSGVTVNQQTVNQAAYFLAQQNSFHPVRDWLNDLRWDGTARLENMAHDYFGCEDSHYGRSVSKAWMISAVGRVMKPGFQAKYLIVLEGPQDQGKSKALSCLVNGHLPGDDGVQWFRDNMPDLGHKDLGQYMQGVWVIEIAELSSIRGASWERTKSFISSPRDTFRRPYGINMQDYPRQCVFAGTTNEMAWGGDSTGLVRFWPLRPTKIRIDAILRDRDQLWAEAKYWYDEGAPAFLDEEADKAAREEQAERLIEEPRFAKITEAANQLWGENQAVTLGSILDKCIIVASANDHHWGRRVAAVMLRSGWVRVQRRRNGVRVWEYEKAGFPGEPDED